MSIGQQVSFLAAALHERTNAYELDAKFYLHRLTQAEQSGFDSGTLAMLRLSADVGTLRQLADAIEAAGKELTKQRELQDAT